MRNKIWKSLLLILVLAATLLLFLDFAYFINGSLELFPTDEQQSGVRAVTGSLAIFLALVDLVLVTSLWQQFKK